MKFLPDFIKKNFLKFIIFCFVGATSALVHMLFFNIFRFWLFLSFILSLIFATCIAIIYNFTINRNFTFKARNQPVKNQLFKYLIVYFISISVNFSVALTMKYILGSGFWQENIATFSGILVSIPFSFLGSLLWAFKNK